MFGAPAIIPTPKNAKAIPKARIQPKLSLKIIVASNAPNGTSNWTSKIAVDASNPFRPVNVRPYWIVALTNANKKIIFNCPTGGGKNQHRINAERVNRKLIKKRGGNSFKPAFAKVNPIPHIMGTDNANPKSLTVRRNMQIFQSYSIFEGLL